MGRNGGTALHSQTQNGEQRLIYPTNLTSGSLYLRQWVQLISSSALTSQNLVVEFADTSGTESNTVQFITGDQWAVDLVSGSYSAQVGPGTLVRNQWVCMELIMVVSNTVGTWRLIVDGQNYVTSPMLDTLPSNEIQNTIIGLASSGDAVELLVDDVYIGTEVVGCEGDAI